jgi:hypothetical protein
MIGQVIVKLAILNITMYVEGWDELLEVGEVRNKIWEVLLEAIVKVDSMLTANIIVVENILYFWMLLHCHC